MEFVTSPGHLVFQTLQQLLLQHKLLQKVAEIIPTIKGIIQIVTKESQRTDHVVIENRMTRTANEDSLGINSLGDRQREGRTSHKRRIPPTFLHKNQPPEKRRDQTLKIQRILLKPL